MFVTSRHQHPWPRAVHDVTDDEVAQLLGDIGHIVVAIAKSSADGSVLEGRCYERGDTPANHIFEEIRIHIFSSRTVGLDLSHCEEIVVGVTSIVIDSIADARYRKPEPRHSSRGDLNKASQAPQRCRTSSNPQIKGSTPKWKGRQGCNRSRKSRKRINSPFHLWRTLRVKPWPRPEMKIKTPSETPRKSEFKDRKQPRLRLRAEETDRTRLDMAASVGVCSCEAMPLWLHARTNCSP